MTKEPVCPIYIGDIEKQTNRVVNVSTKQVITNARELIRDCLNCQHFEKCKDIGTMVSFLEQNDFKC